eukprot:8901399-Pyramimonas_sp.AAC.1
MHRRCTILRPHLLQPHIGGLYGAGLLAHPSRRLSSRLRLCTSRVFCSFVLLSISRHVTDPSL